MIVVVCRRHRRRRCGGTENAENWPQILHSLVMERKLNLFFFFLGIASKCKTNSSELQSQVIAS